MSEIFADLYSTIDVKSCFVNNVCIPVCLHVSVCRTMKTLLVYKDRGISPGLSIYGQSCRFLLQFVYLSIILTNKCNMPS